MTYLLVTDTLPPQKGIVGRLVLETAKALQARGIEVHIISTTHESSLNDWIERSIDGVSTYAIVVPQHTERLRFYRTLYNARLNDIVKRLLFDIKPDVIHFHNIHEYLAFSLILVAQRYRKKHATVQMFATAHDVLFATYDKVLVKKDSGIEYRVSVLDELVRFRYRVVPFRRTLIRWMTKHLDQFICVSQALATWYTRHGFPVTTVLHNAIDVEKWTVAQKQVDIIAQSYQIDPKQMVLYPARVSAAKGCFALAKAMGRVFEQYPNAQVVIVGTSSDSTIGQAILAEIPTAQHRQVVYTGWTETTTLNALYHLATVVVVPSLCLDSFPTVNLEAFACAKPVIGTIYGGTPEIVLDHYNGLLVNPNDTRAFSEAIMELLSDPMHAKQMGERGYHTVRTSHTWNTHIDTLVQLIPKQYRDSCYDEGVV